MAKRKTHNEFIEELKKINSNITVLDEYINSKTKVKCRCKLDGYEWGITPNDLLHGYSCPKCAGTIKKTHNEFIKEMKVKNSNIEILGKYSQNKTKVKCRCKLDGYEWEATPNNLLRGYGCPQCKRNNNMIRLKKTHEHFIEEIKIKNPNVEILDEYIDSKTKIKCKCKIDGNIWSIAPAQLSRGQGCPKCKSSRGEKKIERYCKANYIAYKKQYRIGKCKLKNTLAFDFALFNKNKLIALIEYQGEQHFRAVKYFGGESQFKIQQKRDKVKRDYCKATSIKLIEIPYWEKDIETFIDEQLNNTGNNIQLSII